MTDVVFDIDGTLANAQHRLHHIVPDPNKLYEQPFKKDWDSFLSDEAVAKDEPIEQAWELLFCLTEMGNRIIFITGRPEAQREVTWKWLTDDTCEHRQLTSRFLDTTYARLYMRRNGDRRLSHIVKGELLEKARMDGFDPKIAFEDRKEDTAMWRSKGLLCCQVAEGNY